jgi:glycosyltransferase involved in cell wall biosynthesis
VAREKIGILSVPWMGVPPKGQGSIAGKTHRITQLLADRYEFTIVGGATGLAPHRQHPDIDYVAIDESLDRKYVDRIVGHATRLIGRGRHEYYQPLYHPLYVRRAARVFREAGCTTVVVHEFPQWLPVIAKAVPGARLMVWGGADSFIENDGLLPYLRRADALIGSSRFLAHRFVERLPEMADRCYVVYSGVDVGRFKPGPEPRAANRILYAGRITPEKGVHVLVDAFRALADDRPDLELVLAGPPWVTQPTLLEGSVPHHLDEVTRLAGSGYHQELVRRADPHADRVDLPGQLGGDDLVGALQTATVFSHAVLCEEGFGASVAEALACGAPVVVSDLGAPPEFVTHGSTGMVVPAGDAAQLAEVLADLLDHPERRAAMSREARALAETRLAASVSAVDFSSVLDGTAVPAASAA